MRQCLIPGKFVSAFFHLEFSQCARERSSLQSSPWPRLQRSAQAATTTAVIMAVMAMAVTIMAVMTTGLMAATATIIMAQVTAAGTAAIDAADFMTDRRATNIRVRSQVAAPHEFDHEFDHPRASSAGSEPAAALALCGLVGSLLDMTARSASFGPL
jgi:hypothetical protein